MKIIDKDTGQRTPPDRHRTPHLNCQRIALFHVRNGAGGQQIVGQQLHFDSLNSDSVGSIVE